MNQGEAGKPRALRHAPDPYELAPCGATRRPQSKQTLTLVLPQDPHELASRVNFQTDGCGAHSLADLRTPHEPALAAEYRGEGATTLALRYLKTR